MSKTTKLISDWDVGDMDNYLVILLIGKMMCFFNDMAKRRFLNVRMGRSMGWAWYWIGSLLGRSE